MAGALVDSSTSDNDSCRMMDGSDTSSDTSDDGGPHSCWLDTKALKPFPKDKAAKGSSSALCGACRSFFRGKREEDIKYKHIQFLATLRTTAGRGCHLCALIRNTIDRETANHYPANILSICLEIATAGSQIWYYYRKGSKRPKYGSFVQGIKTIKLVPREDFNGEKVMDVPVKYWHTADSNTWSSGNRQLADQWLSRCLVKHRRCNREAAKSSWLPTRLLDIESRIGSEANVCLVETKDMMSKAQYISLSHCWGRNPVLSLRLSDLAHFKKGIPLESLPKTFRHAIEVTRHFKIRYIWIDSLCIIQDSVDDWQSEASSMRHVYQNAFCNIAATGSPNSHTGLFFERDPSLIPVGRIEVEWDGPFPQGEYCFFPLKFWFNGVSTAPLNRRAWVVQERLLARRVLHFGSQGLFFECCEQEACETFPNGLPSLYNGSIINMFKNIYPNRGEALDNSRQNYERWERVVQAFMRSDLTQASDKAISLSGIAEEFQEHVFQEPYIAGLWKNTLAQELLWMVLRERQANGSPSARPSDYRAPSWSWLSIDGNIKQCVPNSEPTLIEVKTIHIDLLDENHPTGQIKGGYIVVQCHLVPANYRTNASFDPNIAQNYLLFDGKEIGTTTVFFDEAERKPSEDEPIFCLPIVVYRSYTGVQGLILLPTRKKAAEYQRIGLFKAGDKAV
ncbi:MAG: hypothetical protein Q9187_006358, partial [Circinaria calcarea]